MGMNNANNTVSVGSKFGFRGDFANLPAVFTAAEIDKGGMVRLAAKDGSSQWVPAGLLSSARWYAVAA